MAKEIVFSCDKNNCDCKEKIKQYSLQNGYVDHYYEGNYYDKSYTERVPHKVSIDLCQEHMKEFEEFFMKKLFWLVGEEKYYNLVDEAIKEFTGLDLKQKVRGKRNND